VANSVLIVTDCEEDLAALRQSLFSAHDGPFDVESASSLLAATERLKSEGIDIVLLDLTLPDSTGIPTFDALFKLTPTVPIMTLADDAGEEMAIEAVRHGAQGYLTKGYFRNALVPQALKNIIHRKRVEEALYVEKERARVTLESIGDGVLSTDVDGIITYLNAEAERLTGWAREQANGRPLAEVFCLIDGTTGTPARNPVEQVIELRKTMGLCGNSVLVRRDGYRSPIEDSVAPIIDRNGNVSGAVVTFRDVSKVRAMAEQMSYLAQHDFLTGLPNRMLLNDRLAQAIAFAKRHNTQLAVLFLDLDKFKHINDSLGHLTGDRLLESFAARLLATVRQSDTVSRQGGDEFVILLLEDVQAENAAITAEKILQSTRVAHEIDGHKLHVSTSIGISVYPADGADAPSLIKNADTAMYYAKQKGRNNYEFFKSAMNVRAVERQAIEADLRLAIEKGEFVLHYQPKVDLDTGRVTGAEALIRWLHPVKGMILPETFISIAEDCGLIIPIGKWVLRTACMQGKQWKEAGKEAISIAVNISALEFRRRGFFEGVRQALEESGLEPHCLELELTEGVLMRNAEASTLILQSLKKLGVRLAVDDFGTGYSSLSYLSQFPIDVLKIDQSFVHDISSNSSNGIIVDAVIGMGMSLRQKVVAEGVETEEQYSFLHDHRCAEGQGYLFGRPVPADQFRHSAR
jgi:diguanylate cyclase (GGDEF)-like protein/PAS domain S-box-containing protein